MFSTIEDQISKDAHEPLPSAAQCGQFDEYGRLLCTEGHLIVDPWRDRQGNIYFGCDRHPPSGCERFNPYDADVRRILTARGWSLPQILSTAACQCGNAEILERRARQQRLHDSNLPSHDAKTFDNWHLSTDNEKAFEAMKSFVSGGQIRIVTLQGDVGVGKSHLLEAVGREILDAGRSVRYETGLSLVNRIRAVYASGGDESVAGVLNWIKSYHTLLLDELAGDENITDNARGWLFEVIDERYRGNGRLVAATNKTRDEIAASLGDRIASRLWATNEPSVARVQILTDDYRRKR